MLPLALQFEHVYQINLPSSEQSLRIHNDHDLTISVASGKVVRTRTLFPALRAVNTPDPWDEYIAIEKGATGSHPVDIAVCGLVMRSSQNRRKCGAMQVRRNSCERE